MVNFNDYIINKDKLLNNVKRIKRYVGRSTKICAVVKADAYGVGIKNVCPIIEEEVDYFAVVSVKEAMELRLINKVKPILILGFSNLEMINWCADNNVEITISTIEEVQYIARYCNNVINVHIKINTGMNRYGVKSIIQLRQILTEIKKSNNIKIVGVYTHFATKLDNLDFIDFQYSLFEKMVKEIKMKNLIIHCANSFVSTSDKLKLCNMVRVGFSMYSDHYERLSIENVVSIRARVTSLVNIRCGESVGYDRSYIAKSRQKIAIVSMGYADGFARNLSNNFKVIINGEFANVVGKVCMDCFMVDISKIGNVYVGTPVTILGENGGNKITLEDYAKALNFSPYEVLVNFRRRRMNELIKTE